MPKHTKEVSSDFLGTEKISKLLIKLAIPAIIAQVVNLLYNIVDRIYIGHIKIIGGDAITGVGVAMPLIIIIAAFAAFVNMGAAPRSSIFLGQKNKAVAEKIMGNAFVVLLLFSAILTTVFLIFNKNLLTLIGASKNTFKYAYSYMQIYSIGIVFSLLSLGMNAFISAQGKTFISMISVLIGAITNIVLDPIFIFSFKMGVKGAAIATVISQGVSTLFVMSFLISKKTVLKLRLKNLKIDMKIVISFLALGFSPFIMQATESAISIVYNIRLFKFGGDVAVGAIAILTSIMQLAVMPLVSLGQGAQPIISYNYGAKNPERVKKTFKLLLIVSTIYSFGFWILMQAVPAIFGRMFTHNEAIVSHVTWSLRIFMACSFSQSIQKACQLTLLSIGNAKTSTFLALLRKVFLLIPLIFVLPIIFKHPLSAIYSAEPIADTVAAIFTALMFRSYFKKAMASISKETITQDIK